ncbi:MAG: CDGSH iron-sulfur domain-containing protein [Methanomicrobiales archaeon]
MVKKDEMKIKILKDGPYLVFGGIPLSEKKIVTDEEGHTREWISDIEYPLKDTYSLCRCGKSKNKPFCDGTHSKVNFDGTENASRRPYQERAKVFEGKKLKLTDVWEFCDHSRFCLRAGGIRNLIQSDDPEDEKTAIEEATICPSGRLVLWDKETGELMEPPFKPSIVLIQDPQKSCEGPIWVRGFIPVESVDGSTYEVRNRMTLCRCGKSDNKPFCDGSHWMTSEEKKKFRSKWEKE